MPTVLLISGWRLFFYSNEGHEPIHIHAEKAEMECKFTKDIVFFCSFGNLSKIGLSI